MGMSLSADISTYSESSIHVHCWYTVTEGHWHCLTDQSKEMHSAAVNSSSPQTSRVDLGAGEKVGLKYD